MTRRPWLILVAALLTLGPLLAVAPSVTASAPPVPFAGEVVLTSAERRHALDTMRPAERQRIGSAFAADAEGLVLSYSRRLVRIVTGPDGREQPMEIAAAEAAAGSTLSIPTEAVAGTARRNDLYVSLTVVKRRSSPPYEWQVLAYAQWDGPDNMHPVNSSADTLGIAWAGSTSVPTYLHDQEGDGRYYSHWPCNAEPLDIWPSDGSPNVGTAWSFHEWGMWGCPARWGLADIRLRTNSLVGRTDNVVYKYFHTYSGLSYGFTFSRSPSVSISPTNEQWALALFGTYTH